MNQSFSLRVQLLNPAACPPKKAKPNDAAFDLTAIESFALAPNERRTCGLGFSAEFPTTFVALIRDRSSLGSRGLHCLAGVIDASYRGEWKVVLLNTSVDTIEIQPGDRIAQCLFLPVPEVEVKVVDQLTESERGSGGFGSTGK